MTIRWIAAAALVAAGAAALLFGVARGTTDPPGLPNPNVSTTTTEPCDRYDPANVGDPGVVFCPWVPT